MRSFRSIFSWTLLASLAVSGQRIPPPHADALILRGHPQTVQVYGTRGVGFPIIVSSGDGGWTHLSPRVAEMLSAKGFLVVGFDVKSYLESFTSGTTTLGIRDEPGDYRVLATYAAKGSVEKP